MDSKLWLVVLINLFALNWLLHAEVHTDFNLSLEESVKRHGYPIEVHKVITEDDYLLTLYRIPHGYNEIKNKNGNKSAVLLVHGMGGSPRLWFLLGPQYSFPYYLADRGFDVWIASSRGNGGSFGKHHLKYDWIDDANKYWDFSMHEIGVYDLSAKIDHIISHSNQSKVFIVGHSAGGPESLILLSEKPEYNDKVKVAAHWAASPILKRMRYSVALLLCSLTNVWKGLIKYLDSAEIFPQLRILLPLIAKLSQDPEFSDLFYDLSVHIAGIIGSHNSVLMEKDLPTVITASVVAIAPRLSNKMLIHFADIVDKGKFQNYDYGRKINMKVYGQKEPPFYNLSKVVAAQAYFYAPWDDLVVKEDVYDAMNQLSNVIFEYEVPFKKFTHIDFIITRNATTLVYDATVQLFKDFDEGKRFKKIEKRAIPGE